LVLQNVFLQRLRLLGKLLLLLLWLRRFYAACRSRSLADLLLLLERHLLPVLATDLR
jgi:hypothetical protein